MTFFNIQNGIIASSKPASSGSGGDLPTRSLTLAAASNKYLSMSDTNFGAFDRAKWALSCWVKRATVGAGSQVIISQYPAGNRSFEIYFSDDTITIQTSQNGTGFAGFLQTDATYTSTSNWHHILFHYDSANATADNRMRLWADGSEVTSFSSRTNPTAAVFNSSGDVVYGVRPGSSGYFDGLIYQPAFFSGTLPAIGSVYNAGAAVDLTSATGLQALLNTNATDALEDDYVLSANWTNNNSVIKSTTIP